MVPGETGVVAIEVSGKPGVEQAVGPLTVVIMEYLLVN